MRVTLVVPPFLPGYSHSSRSPAVARSGTFYYPIWLAYGAAGLEKHGHEVQLLDGPALGLSSEELLARTRGFQPDLIVVDIATPSAESDLAFARQAAGVAPIAAGGVQTIASPDFVRRELPDATLVLSDYDEALPAICESVSRPETVNRPAENLDGNIFVASIYKRHLRTHDYFYACTRYPFVSILAGRGCPYSCVFCHWPATISGTRYRTRSPEDIVAEMKFVERELPEVREIFFEDDTFNIDERVVAARCEAMLRAGVRIPWSANVRPKASRETLVLMRRAGARLALVGYESGADSVLGRVGKATREDDLRRFAEDARAANLMIHGCFILGLPGETRESMKRTVELAMSLRPDTAQFYPYMPYPATPGAQSWDGRLSDSGRHLYGGAELPAEEVNAACDEARRRYYLRPGYIARKALQSLVSPPEMIRNIKAFRTFLPTLAR